MKTKEQREWLEQAQYDQLSRVATRNRFKKALDTIDELTRKIAELEVFTTSYTSHLREKDKRITELEDIEQKYLEQCAWLQEQ